MPNPPAYLDISCEGLNEEEIAHIEEIVFSSEFYLDDQMAVTKKEHMFHISPFEKNKDNESTVVHLKDQIASEFSEHDVSLDRNKNEPAHYGDFGYSIQVDSDNVASDDSNQSQTSSDSINTNETIEDSNTPEWRAFDTDRRDNKSRLNAPGTDSTKGESPEWRDTINDDTQNESSLEDREKNRTTKAVEHTIYEEIPARKKIRLEYVESADSLEEADREVVEPQGVVESTLYCECGEVFEKRESAVDHVRDFCS